MLKLQFNNFLVNKINDWCLSNLKVGNRYRYYSDDTDHIKALEDAFNEIEYQTLSFDLKSHTQELKYVNINDIKLIFLSDLELKDSYISSIRDAVSSNNSELEDCALLVLHTSRLDTLINSAIDLASEDYPLNYTVINKELKTLIQTSTEYKKLFKYLLNYQTEIIKEEAQSVFGYEVLYKSILNNKVDFKSLELFEDEDLYKFENDDKKIEKRISDNDTKYRNIKNILVNFPNEIEDKLSIYSPEFIKKELTIDDWEKVTYNDLKKEIENNEGQLVSFKDMETNQDIEAKLFPRDDSTSASGKRNKNIIVFVDTSEISLFFNFVGTGVKTDQFSIKHTKEKEKISFNFSGISKELQLDIKDYEFKPFFFTLALKRPKPSENHNFKILILKKDSFYLDNIQNSFLIKPNRQEIVLQLDDLQIDFNSSKDSSIVLKDENQKININNYTSIDLEEYYSNNDVIKFSITNDIDDLSFFVEGAKEEESISIPFLFNKDKLDKLFNKNKNIEFNKTKDKAIYENREFKLIADRLTYIKYEQELIDDTEYIKSLKEIDEDICNSYKKLLNYFRENRTTPSLCSWNDKVLELSKDFISNYLKYMENVEENISLDQKTKTLFEFGFIKKDNRKLVSPFSPLILSYIVNLVEEAKDDISYKDLSEVTISRLNTKGLFPYLFIDNDKYAFTTVVKDNAIWLEFISNEENEFSYIKKLSYEKIDEFTSSFKDLFEFKKDAPLILNSVNNGENHELFEGIVKYYKENISKTPIKMIVNLYDEKYTQTSFDTFADLDKYEDIKNQFSFIKNDDDTLIDIIRTHLTYSKHDIKDKQNYCHLSFFKNNEKVTIQNRTLAQTKSGLVSNALISGESSQKDNGYYYSGFGLKNIKETNKTHIRLAKIYNSMQKAVYEDGTNYESDKTISLMISEKFKELLTKSYENSLWTVIIDPKVTLEFFDNEENLILIHYSDQYSSSANYDAVTVTAKKELYSDVIFQELGNVDRENIVKQFNAFNGEWLIKMINEKETIKKERESIIAAYKYITALLDTDDITWVPLSVAEMIRVSGNVGLEMSKSDFTRHNNKDIDISSSKGSISDDILLVGFKDDGVVLYPVEVKSHSGDMKKANTQAKALKEFFYENLFVDNSLRSKLLKGLFIRQVFMQVEKYELYNIFQDNYFEEIYRIREELLEGTFDLVELENYSTCAVIAFLKDEYGTRTQIKEDKVLEIRLPFEHQKDMLQLSYDDLKTKLQNGEFGTNSKFFLSKNTEKKESITPVQEVLIIDDTEEVIKKEIEVEKVSLEPIKIKFGENNLNQEDICWYPTDTRQNQNTNTGIIGTMGTGKTQFTKSLVTQLVKQSSNNVSGSKIDMIIFDYKGDYVGEEFVSATGATVYELEKLPINPLELFGGKPKLPTHTGRTLTTTLSKAFNLGNVQKSILKNAIQEAYKSKGIEASEKDTWNLPAPTLADVWNLYCESDDVKQDSLYAALDDLIDFEIFESDTSQTKSLYDVIDGVTVINLSGYDSNIQNLVVAIILDLFYVQMHNRGSSKVDGDFRQITKMILVDEADNFMSQDFDSLKKILKEGREFGVGTILSTQELTHFKTSEDNYANYIFTWIIHKVSNIKTQDIQSIFNINNKGEAESLMSQVRELQKHYSFYVDGNKEIKKMRDLAFWELRKGIE